VPWTWSATAPAPPVSVTPALRQNVVYGEMPATVLKLPAGYSPPAPACTTHIQGVWHRSCPSQVAIDALPRPLPHGLGLGLTACLPFCSKRHGNGVRNGYSHMGDL
jgi:hypothetical protein